MLHYFRRYQQYIYLVVTFVIVISFSFFGTYGTLSERTIDEGPGFTAYDGSKVSAMELNEYERFFASDNTDKLMNGGVFGPNFLNDGIIANVILEKNLAFPLFKQLEGEIAEETRSRFQKEKSFEAYKNPKAPFLSAENSWNYFVPEMNKSLSHLKASQDPFEESVFQAKTTLYIGQRRIPPQYLKQMLLYQQSQYGDKFVDRDLPMQDLSLFGYKNLDEWFGVKFVKALSAFVINASMIAEEKGYVVTKEEAQADLMRQALKSFKENKSSPHMTAANVSQYFQEQLRVMQMDQTTAIKIWQRAMLFKRLMNDVGGSVFISALPFQGFHAYSGEAATGIVYALPESLRLRTPKDFELFEVYLEAISKNAELPPKLKTESEIAKSTPELVQKNFVLDVAKVSETDLLGRIGLKEMWRWQGADSSFATLTKQFPELGKMTASTADERQSALDALDSTTRQRINSFSKKEILKAHPEWIKEALANAEFNEMSFNLNLAEGPSPLAGIDNKELQKALEGKSHAEAISLQSKDNLNHYLIKVKDAKKEPVVLTFADAKKNGTLDKILDKKLKSHYEKIRTASPGTYQNADGSWKNLPEVENAVAEDLFANTLSAMKKQAPKETSGLRDLAPYRFVEYVKKAKSGIANNQEDLYVKNEEDTGLNAQWKLEKNSFQTSRSSKNPPLIADMKDLPLNTLSEVIVQPEGDVYFFSIKEKGVKEGLGPVAENALFIQDLLGTEAKKHLFNDMLKKMTEKNALELSIFKREK